ncbi:hypothetical protein IW140_005297 [Coemansia sp. RSA 1813]|nr:hypothetical protein EV178_005762 [Coemansia sp. RSA 1646]KAJ1768798.1 hypothetical protein LPJ74_004598 [Coemansia sp. RSA 1843]KAJ2086361.1 hypothetical protein IW138_005732 [Coemansia sp. RSA 986]KAJ2212286.1 hypothetical protein EV179_004756 [Coemansia sp. RSA 487]KAJ2565608.1 hypothetical protein IW140_005297 [Coemansia sp. RSA 1813]
MAASNNEDKSAETSNANSTHEEEIVEETRSKAEETGKAGEAASVSASSSTGSQSYNKETISKTRLYIILVGLSLLYFVSALETTILATVYIDISNEYKNLSNGIWIITSYLLSNTAVQPLYGKLSDILGRFWGIATATGIFCIGSILCAVSNSLGMLIASRAIQGIGGGGLMTMVSIVLSDVTTERDRGKYTGILASTWGIASAVGPVMGGAIVENASWRIIFWINLPVSVPPLVMLFLSLNVPKPAGTAKEKFRRMDILGSAVFQAFIIPLIIAFAWGGQGFNWVSGRVLGTIGASAAVGILFLWIEWKVAKEPIVSLRLFRKRNVTASALGSLCMGACIYAPMMFIPQWELSVKRASEISSGLHLLPLVLGMVITATFSGIYIARMGRYLELIWACGILIATGNSLLLLLDQNSGNGMRLGFLLITGLGLGLGVQTMIIAAQCAVTGLEMAATTTLVIFTRTLGGILSLSILSSVFNNRLRTEAAKLVLKYPQYAQIIHDSLDDQSILGKNKDLPPDVRQGMVDMFQDALNKVFLALTPFSGLLVLSTLLFTQVKLNRRRKKTIK